MFPGFAFGVDLPTYTKTANESILVALQIESKLGLENVDEISAVEGVGELSHNGSSTMSC
jgi:4-hydroxy-2-oxoheptanedioate aldolase